MNVVGPGTCVSPQHTLPVGHPSNGSSLDSFNDVELLSIEQFAAKMAVSRTTVYEWFKSGYLKAGRHYIKLGTTVRFAWGTELLQRLMEDSVDARTAQKVTLEHESLVPRSAATGKKGLQINQDLLN